MKVRANGLSLEVEDTGPGGTRDPVLLVMGLGMQLTAWPDDLVQALVAAGHRVVRFDNRDIGRSEYLDQLGVPNLLWATLRQRFGLPVHAPYTLHDLAADALGVLDALGIARAHIVGASMGGMIAQRVALRAPARVTTLTSLMSSSGARYLPGPRPRVVQVMLGRPTDLGEAAVLAYYVRLFQAIGSPGFPTPEPELRRQILASVRRGGYHPAGSARQLAAASLSAAKAAMQRNDLASAADHFREALKLNPNETRAQQGLEAVNHRAEELYLDAYMIRDREPREAADKFRMVMDVLPKGSETYEKAKNQLAALGQ